MRLLRILAITIAIILALGAGAYAYLTAREAVPETTKYVVDLDELSRLARSEAGPLPRSIHHELVAIAGMPRAAIFAGEPFETHDMGHGSYQIRYPDDSFVLVDAAFSQEDVDAMPGESRFDARAYDNLMARLPEARAVVLTHEHFDHIAGLGDVEDIESLAPRVLLNPEQLASEEAETLLSEELRSRIVPIDYETTHVVAPGVVLLRAPGHTPGSQIIYVVLEDDRELLLIGDVAWHLDQIRELHYRPRLVTDLVLGENRAQVLDQFRALYDLMEEGRVEVISSHDLDSRRALIDSGVLGEGFP